MCCLHVLVGAAVQTPHGETRQEVGGNSGQEWAKPAFEPQLDEGGIIEFGRAEGVQSDFSYRVQNH